MAKLTFGDQVERPLVPVAWAKPLVALDLSLVSLVPTLASGRLPDGAVARSGGSGPVEAFYAHTLPALRARSR